MNTIVTLPPIGNLKPNLKASPSLSTHAKSAELQSCYRLASLDPPDSRVWGSDLISRKTYTV